MNILRKLTSITTAAALAASALVPLSTAASAEGWQTATAGGYGQSYNAYNYPARDMTVATAATTTGTMTAANRYAYGGHRHHDNGKYIALGVGALMLGIIASEASHR